jgi:transcription elongation GreA/GreB family factor
MTLKESIHQVLRIQLKFRIDEIQNILDDLHLSGSRDAKSSAGDKHETGVAMAQLEQEKLRYQIQEFQKMEEIVKKINPSNMNSKIHLGSLVQTDKGWFYISVGLGSLTFKDQDIFAINPEAPFGKALIGKEKGDSIHFNGVESNVLQVL